MAQYEHLPIYRKAFDLAVYIEKIVRGFSRYNKHTLGSDLRNLSRQAIRLIVRANSQHDKVPALLRLRDTLEELKVTIRICKEAKAFASFNVFKNLVSEVISLSRQCEGWIRSMSRGKR
jgi:Zn-dependent M32 family carboxypeptidase